MTYTGASTAAQTRKMLGGVLETLQKDPNIPPDVMSVAANIAHAVGALFEAERASSDVDGKASIRHAMGSLSQTMALLQDVRGKHEGIDIATRTLAEVMGKLYPLAQAPTHRPSRADQPGARASVPGQAPIPREALAATMPSVPPQTPPARGSAAAAAAAAPPPRSSAGAAPPARVSVPQAPPYTGPREKLEANVGATTESNFFVGFSGDISEGGVFVATYLTLSVGDRVEVLVTLPGGFEKTIPGTVRFVRDPMDMESEPGIGVRFDKLDDDARELILRFIRKRPPLFYDE